ncbi:MAG: hypothetical protein IIZ38_17915 [Sphingomonas sp.]|uniref:hypothetical protein n=1 Tax=unclassified Sphingomonas TaxID=196159 RepID=UPI0024550C06|nr:MULTISPECIES: hypothetical protein [unclassified Sphingomonas]MBQ1500187.1 hypothetical protein [Sphingomonas sp.]MDH4745416.1 hypothetical protein [Sphingomonas sp. CBMAI 2297]
MLLMLRLLSLVVGGFTVWRVLYGQMPSPLFKGPCIAVGAWMVLSALLPGKNAAWIMSSANSCALGVYLVALAGYLGPSKPVEPLLVAGMVANLMVILLLRSKLGHRAH